MIVLNEKNIFLENMQSSKGNQLKGCLDGRWYKADYLGYEGLAEYMVSGRLWNSWILQIRSCFLFVVMT